MVSPETTGSGVLGQDLTSLLHRTFGFPEFRANQQAVCEASVAGRDVLLVMPTGAGKSLCYQLPAIARGGTALVISPLIALMDDQAQKLSDIGLRVGRIHSGLDREQSRAVCRDYLDGKLQFLFIAPERLKVPGFLDMLAKRRLALIAVDEAHCISQWGHDFRPDYRNLARHIESLRPAPVIALTATATPQVQRDIVSELHLHDPALFIHGFRRTNLAIEVVEVSKPRRSEMARKLLSNVASRPAIVYAPSRKDAETLAGELQRDFPAAAYHAGLPPATRETVQRDFLAGDLEVVVATVAFGMGIDKADVRTVIHVAMPASVEGYYQEIGRAGRDGSPSRAILMYSWADRRMHDFFLERDYPPADTLSRIATRLSDEPVHADDLRIALRLDMENFAPALDKLLAQGAAEIDFSSMVTRGPAAGREWRSSYESQVSFRRGQIDAMMRYAGGAECRMAALIRHFGDRSDGSRNCGLCDFCAPSGASAQPFRDPTVTEEREMRRILRSLAAAPSKSTGKLHTELHPAGKIDRKEFDALLDALGRAGYLSMESAIFTADDGRDIAYRKASITHEGREVEEGADLVGVQMRDASATTSSRPSRARKSSPRPEEKEMQPLTDAQKKIETALRAWRLSVAADLKQPAFCIFGDRALRAIAVEQPDTPNDLLAIHGLGKAKVDRWGEQICGVLADFEQHLAGTQDSRAQPPRSQPSRSPNVESSPFRNGEQRNGKPQNKKQPRRSSPAPVEKTSSPNDPANRRTAPPTASALAVSAPPRNSLEYTLKIWRMHEAKRHGMAPFVLMLDATLREVARARPTTPDDLRRISGITTAWVDRFGSALCLFIADFLATEAQVAAASASPV